MCFHLLKLDGIDVDCANKRPLAEKWQEAQRNWQEAQFYTKMTKLPWLQYCKAADVHRLCGHKQREHK